MRDKIPYIIKRELLSGRTVELLEVGVLALERVGAQLRSDGSFTAPCDTLVFSSEFQDGGFISTLADCLKENSRVGAYFDDESFLANASSLYFEWLDSSLSEDGALLTIEGLCVIDRRGEGELVTIDNEFSEMLTPFSSPLYYENSSSEDVYDSSDSDEIVALHKRIADLEAALSQNSNIQSMPQAIAPRRVPRVSKVSTTAMVLSIIAFSLSIIYIALSAAGILKF